MTSPFNADPGRVANLPCSLDLCYSTCPWEATAACYWAICDLDLCMHLKKGEEPYPGYRLVQFLGRGGWGEVWKAVRLADNACFALKFLTSDSQLAASQEIRALQAIRQLSHPNLVRIEQVWSCPGYLVVVMEMAEGNLLDL